MKYQTAAAFRQALEAHLRREADERATSVIRLRKLITFDRLLARLAAAATGRWLLKGALAIDFRLGARARGTKDLDLARQDDIDAAKSDLLAAQALDLGDFFIFRIEQTRLEEPEEEHVAARFRAHAELAGRPFETVLIDIGFSDPPADRSEQVRGPDLLSFAGIEPVEVPTLPLAQQVAEKLHAFTREYSGGRRSSRVKDLVDLLLIKSFAGLDAVSLRKAISETFRARGTHPVPGSVPPPPSDWRGPYRRLATDLGVQPRLEVAQSELAEFLDPVLAARASGRWNPERGTWDSRTS